jgi:hypothetical protein
LNKKKPTFLAIKVRKKSCPQKVVIIFFGNRPGDFFRQLKNPIFKGLKALYLHSCIQMGLWGKNFEQNHQKAPILLREMVQQRTKFSAGTKYNGI